MVRIESWAPEGRTGGRSVGGTGTHLSTGPGRSARRLGVRVLIYTLALALLLFPLIALAGASRAYYKEGTATTTNATITFTFNPTSFCLANDEASGGTNLWVDFTDGVAVAASNSTNIKVPPTKSICFSNGDTDPNRAFTVGVITSSSTAAYRVYGYRNQ